MAILFLVGQPSRQACRDMLFVEEEIDHALTLFPLGEAQGSYALHGIKEEAKPGDVIPTETRGLRPGGWTEAGTRQFCPRVRLVW